MASLTEVSGIPKSTEEDSESSVPALAGSSALPFPGVLLCPETQTRMTLNHQDKVIRKGQQRSYGSLTVRKDRNERIKPPGR